MEKLQPQGYIRTHDSHSRGVSESHLNECDGGDSHTWSVIYLHSGCVKTKVNNYPTPGVPRTPGVLCSLRFVRSFYNMLDMCYNVIVKYA